MLQLKQEWGIQASLCLVVVMESKTEVVSNSMVKSSFRFAKSKAPGEYMEMLSDPPVLLPYSCLLLSSLHSFISDYLFTRSFSQILLPSLSIPYQNHLPDQEHDILQVLSLHHLSGSAVYSRGFASFSLIQMILFQSQLR